MNSALDGVVVIDLSRVLAGPFAAQILGDHGAEVIKFEAFAGDDTRSYGPPFVDGDAPYYLGLNRNKKNIGIDLSSPKGRDVLFNALAHADVLIENFKLSTWKKWGIESLDLLSRDFPRLIHCRISGFGDDGEYGGLPGYDAVLQAMSGLMSINGEPEVDATRIGIPLVDTTTGMNAAMGVLLAMHERARSGRGQRLEVTLYDTALAMLHPHTSNVLHGSTIKRTGNSHPNIVPYDLFTTRSGKIFIAIGNNRQFKLLCKELGREDLALDTCYATNADRVKNRDSLTFELNKALANRDAEPLFKVLMTLGVPCGPVHTVEQALALPHTGSRCMQVQHEAYRGVGIPIKLGRTPGGVRLAPSKMGEHSDELLHRFGFGESAIKALYDQDVVRGPHR